MQDQEYEVGALTTNAGLLLVVHSAPFEGRLDTVVLFAVPQTASTGLVVLANPDVAAAAAPAGLTTTLAAVEEPNVSDPLTGVPTTVNTAPLFGHPNRSS